MSDGRTYDFDCTLSAVTSTDGMTVGYYQFDYDFLSRNTTRVINEVHGISRVSMTSNPSHRG